MLALHEAVRKALERQELIAEDPKLRRSLKRRAAPDVFVGTSTRMRLSPRRWPRWPRPAFRSLSPGESGTGKELVARALHDRSGRGEGPFVAINCAGLADNLIESELFGHVRGAFTGAISDRPGAFQLASGGTLFLDEIGDLSLKGQGDLLRILEDGVYRPVGSHRPIRANVRIVAATNRDLARLANEGRFREDVLFRLNIVELNLPPLRERPEDIPALADSFNAHFAARHGRKRKIFSPEFLARLSSHRWPGNVRQLRNLIERLVVTVRESPIGPEYAPASPGGGPAGGESVLFAVKAGASIAEVEAQLIRETLGRVGGSRRQVAGILGISPRALAYKIKLLHVPPRENARDQSP